MKQTIFDQLSRPLHDLRISVIDRCNFRCPYCMPEEEFPRQYKFLREKEWLTFEEILRLTKLFVQCGVSKVRLTGGEPLLRPDLPELIQQLSKIPGIQDLALTTNASLLAPYAAALKESGLQRLTVSLDTMDARIFKFLSGQKGSLKKVLEGIAAAEQAGFEHIKINVVVQRGVNDHAVLDLVEYFKNSKHSLRFIEYMDVGNCNHWDPKLVVSSQEIIQILRRHFKLTPLPSQYFGEVAARFRIEEGPAEIGLISSISKPFCRNCTRLRLSVDGKIYTCLFANQGTDLRAALREGKTDPQILEMIKTVWQAREDRYSELRSIIHAYTQNPRKVEMFQIGG